MELTKKTIGHIVMGFIFLGLAGCSGPFPGDGEARRLSGFGQQPEKKAVDGKIIIDEKDLAITLNENVPRTVVLPYKSEGGAIPASCEVRSPISVTAPTPCVCLGGTCRSEIQPGSSGDGSFSFRLLGQNGISSGFKTMKVRILEVTLSAVSEEKQRGTVGETLAPIVVSAKNSNKEPVSGAKILWEPLGGSQVDSPSCMEKTDDQGSAKCTWTLGTKMEDDDTYHRLRVSAFDKFDSQIPTRFKVIFDGNLTPGPPFKLSFTPQDHGTFSPYYGPGDGERADRILRSGGVRVFVQDKYGNRTTGKSVVVTMSLGKGPEGGTLSGNVNEVTSKEKGSQDQDVAYFKTLQLTKVGTYTIVAASPGLQSATSKEFTILPSSPSELRFSKQPKGAKAGSELAQQPEVLLKDAYGNIVVGAAGQVVSVYAVEISSRKEFSFFDRESSVRESNRGGVVVFTNLRLDHAGKYKLRAEAGRLSTESEPFDITPGEARKLAFTVDPGGGPVKSIWTQQPKVAVQDAFDNIAASSSAKITVAFGNNPGSGTLSGKTEVSAVDGMANFADLSTDKAGVGYTLKASSPGLADAVSGSFDITPGSAVGLAFIQQPKGGMAGKSLVQEPRVAIQDASGNTVTTSSAKVTLTLSASLGTEGFSGRATVEAKEGVASFPGLSLKKAGKYTLQASSPSLAGAMSSDFDITHGMAAKLVFTQQPGGAVAKKVFAIGPTVAIQDDCGNRVISGPDAGASLSIALASGEGKLSGATSVMATVGVATWKDLSIDLEGSKTLRVTKEDLQAKGGVGSFSIDSNTFDNAKEGSEPGNFLAVVPSLQARGEDGAVILEWGAPTGATGYKILRGLKEDSLAPLGDVQANTYRDSAVSNGEIYFYAVKAVYPAGVSENSKIVKAQPLSRTSIESLAVNDKAGGGALEVSWKASIGASSYTVKYSSDPGSAATQGKVACTATVPERTCIVKELVPGTTYYFTVKATNEYNGDVYSPELSGVPRPVPTLSLEGSDEEALKKEDGFFLKVVTKFEALGATKFILQYGTEAGVYPKTKEAPGSDSGGIWLNEMSKSGSNITHYFKVVAVFPNGELSSKERSITATPPFAGITSALPGDRKIRLTLGEPAVGAKSHVISCFKPVSNEKNREMEVMEPQTSVEFTELANLQEYRFSVKATLGENVVKYGTTYLSRFPAKPQMSLPPKVTLYRSLSSETKPKIGLVPIAFKEGQVLKGIPSYFATAFYPERDPSICGNTKSGCDAKIEASYSDDKITLVRDDEGVTSPPEARDRLFIYKDGVVDASYSDKGLYDDERPTGIILDLSLNPWAVEGTATLTVTFKYGLETVTGSTQLELLSESKKP